MAHETTLSLAEIQGFISAARGHYDDTQSFIAELGGHADASAAFFRGAAGDAARNGLHNLSELLTKQNQMFHDCIDTVEQTVHDTFASNEDSASTIAHSMAEPASIVSW